MFTFTNSVGPGGLDAVLEGTVPQSVEQIHAKAAAGKYGDASEMIAHFMQIAQEEGRVAAQAAQERGRYEANAFNGGHVHCG